MTEYRIIWSKSPKDERKTLIVGTAKIALESIDVILTNGHILHEVKPGRADELGGFHVEGSLR